VEPLVDITVTAPDAGWVAEFTRRLVTDRIVACGNIVPTVRSIYRWAGEVQDEAETLVIFHTRASLVETVIRRTKQEHPYDEPQIVVLPIQSASAGYHRWVLDSTEAPTSVASGRSGE
jgi:periplasmic divalent cation tolerance protein